MINKKLIRTDGSFSSITISLSSPESILSKSSGEVLKPETINYRTFKPERDGLFCERIFGPIKDYECGCGKYKRIRYKGIVCDRCGVEITEKKIRREKIGHINLVIPIVHIWYFRSLPNKIGYLTGLSSKRLEMIIYYEKYVVIQAGVKENDGIKYLDFLSEDEYIDIMNSLPKENKYLDDTDPNKFIAKMGGEALKHILKNIDLDDLSYKLRHQAMNETSQQRKNDALKRLNIVELFRNANSRIENNPEWMIIDILPVIPPDLRPLVPLDGGRFAASDINDLYRRVIIRNNRLKRLIEIKAPEVILRNEKRMLQESIDSLFDNSRKANAVKTEGNRNLKSLSDVLKGKQGRFRQNLLGKRVDYSGRSVIVIGPNLSLHECGLPKEMCAELYKPFIIRKLLEREIVKTVKSAKKIIDNRESIVWEILENILIGHPVLLNRAPTLHRLGIQAFQPKLIEGKAIQLHPLVCTAFNADFDGDQMAVHIPLSNAAIVEAQLLMLASHNILNPANGMPITVPSQDMVLGLYYLTKELKNNSNVRKNTFYDYEEVNIAYNHGILNLHSPIRMRAFCLNKKGYLEKSLIDTTVGRVLFNELVPEELGFINEVITKKSLRDIISKIIYKVGIPKTVDFLDKIKNLGFKNAFEGGLSFNLKDLIIPDNKSKLIDEANAEVKEIWNNYNIGLITNNERYNQIIDIWTKVNSNLTDNLIDILSKNQNGFNSVYMMIDSGARGSKEQIRQLCGIRGLMAKPQKSGIGGEIVENPILSNFKEGLSVLEYFISTHGARKGLADTALKTADAGYLTRRLHDVAQDVIITEYNCNTLRGVSISSLKDNEDIVEPLYDRILGRVALNDIYDPIDNSLYIESGCEIDEIIAEKIENSSIESVDIRSVLTCESNKGVCVKCYGRNLSSGNLVQIGEAVGVIAAQSIGEPGTQLTLRTFHVGGTASSIAAKSQITAKFSGKLIFDSVKYVNYINNDDIVNCITISRSGEFRIIDNITGKILKSNNIPYGSNIMLKNNSFVNQGDVICTWDPYNAVIISEISGVVRYESIIEDITYREESDEQTGHREKVIIDTRDKSKNPVINIYNEQNKEIKSYNIPVGAHIIVNHEDKVHAGQILVKIPRLTGRTRDITGGLPRVTELFEARNPSNPAIVSEINGVVTLGSIKRGNKEIIIESKNGDIKKYLIPLSKHILVQNNDFVNSGDPLSDGSITPSDILSIKGPRAVQEYLVNEIQEVYRLQGVKINDKHFEVIVKQMMQKVIISDPGHSKFIEKECVNKNEFNLENNRLYDKKVISDKGDSLKYKNGQIISSRELHDENSYLKKQNVKLMQYSDAKSATSVQILQGITKSSLGTKSFIAAASFQETTKVLNEAAISAKVDSLVGLKENVIVGHLIPAGTGIIDSSKVEVYSKDEYNTFVDK
ncbi:MAG: DNA-directed RNA polymerase subunit beta' [Bacteroides sp.]|nr:MAG: DNA-directed RNA polymerase subunit beta' [Bacteroides sp.]